MLSQQPRHPSRSSRGRHRHALGIHIGHDRAAALVRDGELISYVAQERIDRKKYSVGSALPYEAIYALLGYNNISMNHIDSVGVSFDNTIVAMFVDDLADELKFKFQMPHLEVRAVQHHLAHALSAYATSGFDDALVLVADGSGDLVGNKHEAETLFSATGDKIEIVEQRLQSFLFDTFDKPYFYNARLMPPEWQPLTVSIGKKYEQFTNLLGFGWEQHGKTMGLAAYGAALFDIPRIDPQGLQFDLTAIDLLVELEHIRARRGMSTHEFVRRERANIARTIQEFTEQILISLLASIRKHHRLRPLCLAGGVFLNCVANHKLASTGLFENIYIVPACADDGQAIGAAFEAYRTDCGKLVHHSTNLPYLGLSYDAATICAALTSHSLLAEYFPDDKLARYVAERLSQGAVVGVVRGRTEIGPRALCHRSIFMDPRRKDAKEYLNRHVKFREEFRPYAPIVTAEDQFKYFDLAVPSPFMLMACGVREIYRDVLPAVTHVDGTARVQAIEKCREPFVHSLLREFGSLSGIPILLNTSFNVAGEPIVESPRDAIRTFSDTKIDVLVLENYVVEKTQQGAAIQ